MVHILILILNSQKKNDEYRAYNIKLNYNTNGGLHSNRAHPILFDFQVEDHRVVSVPYHSVQVCMFEKNVPQWIKETSILNG